VPTRAQALAVAYIALVAVVFAADVVLLVASMRSASAVQSLVPGLVEKFSSGLVTGSYSVVPYSSGYPSGQVRGYATYISLVNPNPFTVDVVVLAYVPGYPGAYRVFDIYDPSQLQWYTGSPPPGVSVVQAPSWDPGSRYALRMAPNSYAAFTVPTTFGSTADAPAVVLACTQAGCYRLQRAGSADLPTGVQRWVLSPPGGTTGREAIVEVPASWAWGAYTIAGPVCLVATPSGVVPYVSCCGGGLATGCASTFSRGVCASTYGQIPAFTSIYPLPPLVIGGFYYLDTSRSFTFSTSGITVWAGGWTQVYPVYWDKSRVASLAPKEWGQYPNQNCFDRVVEIAFTVDLTPLKQYSTVYVFAAVQATGQVSLHMSAPGWGHAYTVSANNGYADNRNGVWSVGASSTPFLIFRVRYVLPGGAPGCFTATCGDPYVSRAGDFNFAFLIQLIPR